MRLKFVETLVDLDAGLKSDRQSTGYGYDSVTIKPRHPLMSLSFYKWVNISILIRLTYCKFGNICCKFSNICESVI